jgi:hypothetical protein
MMQLCSEAKSYLTGRPNLTGDRTRDFCARFCAYVVNMAAIHKK